MQKYLDRAIQWSLPNWGLALSAKLYNTFVISVLSYIWQLQTPNTSMLIQESTLLKRLAPGPRHWIETVDLFRLDHMFGLPVGFRSIAYSSMAAKVRVFFNEDIDWQARRNELQSLLFSKESQTNIPLQWLTWYKNSYIFNIWDTVHSLKKLRVDPFEIWSSLLLSLHLSPRSLPVIPLGHHFKELTEQQQSLVKARKQIQRLVYKALILNPCSPILRIVSGLSCAAGHSQMSQRPSLLVGCMLLFLCCRLRYLPGCWLLSVVHGSMAGALPAGFNPPTPACLGVVGETRTPLSTMRSVPWLQS